MLRHSAARNDDDVDWAYVSDVTVHGRWVHVQTWVGHVGGESGVSMRTEKEMADKSAGPLPQ